MRRFLLRFTVFTLVIVLILGAVALHLLDGEPSWYRPPDARDPSVLKHAEDMEYRLVEEVHRLRSPEDAFTLRIREQHANAWLAARLPKWIVYDRGLDWPDPLGTPQVRFTHGGIDIAGSVGSGLGRRYLVVRLAPSIEEDQLALTVAEVSLGRAALTRQEASRLIELLPSDQKAQLLASEFGALLADALTSGAMLEPTLHLADGRRLRLQAITLHEGAVDLTAVTMAE